MLKQRRKRKILAEAATIGSSLAALAKAGNRFTFHLLTLYHTLNWRSGMASKAPVTVFVYGTLKQGFRNNHVFEKMNATFIKKDRIRNATIFIGEWSRVPFITDAKDREVVGELWSVDAKYIPGLNSFERAYTPREVITVSGVKALAYYAPEGETPYAKGDAIEIGSEYLTQHQLQPKRQVKTV